MANDFDDLLTADSQPVDPPREPRIIRVDPKLRGIDTDAFDDLLETVKPARKAKPKDTLATRNRAVHAQIDHEFSDLLDEAALATARRLAEWEPRRLVLGYAKLTCACCGAVDVQQLGVYVAEYHKRNGALHYTLITGRIGDEHVHLPREEDVISETTLPECARCFMLGPREPESMMLPMFTHIPAPPEIVRILDAVLNGDSHEPEKQH